MTPSTWGYHAGWKCPKLPEVVSPIILMHASYLHVDCAASGANLPLRLRIFLISFIRLDLIFSYYYR